MPTVTIKHAEKNLAALIKQAERGEEVLLTRGKKIVAKIVPVAKSDQKRFLAILRGQIRVTREFFEPLPHDEFWS